MRIDGTRKSGFAFVEHERRKIRSLAAAAFSVVFYVGLNSYTTHLMDLFRMMWVNPHQGDVRPDGQRGSKLMSRAIDSPVRALAGSLRFGFELGRRGFW